MLLRLTRFRLAASVLAAATLVAVAPSSPTRPAPAEAADGVAAASQQLDAAQARLADLNDQVERAHGQLDLLDRQLAADAVEEKKVGAALDQMARFEYTQPSFAVRLLSARSLGDLFSTIQQARLVGSRQQAMLDRQRAIHRRDQRARDEESVLLRKVTEDRAQAKQVAEQAQAALAAAQSEAGRQQAASVAAQAAAINSAPVRYGAYSGGNHFTYGYCTWYVANKRPIPWFGNAIEWWPNARAYGFAEGSTPRVGAVMVTRESGTGHVAYVESVNSDGSWTVSEMNYVSWGVVSSRTIRPGQVPLVGFIY